MYDGAVVEQLASQRRHRVFVAHLALCAPFLWGWLALPVGGEARHAYYIAFASVATLYIASRAWLAWFGPSSLRWELWFPPVDVALISAYVALGSRDPLDNATILYLFPLAEAAGTLRTRWALAVGLMALVGAALATGGLAGDDPYNAWFRYVLLLVLGSLLTWLARLGVELRTELALARERAHMAAEMHDGLQAHLVTASAQAQLLGVVAQRDPARAPELASGVQASVRSAADELRYLVQRMRAPATQHAFPDALAQYVRNVAERAGLEATVTSSGQVGPLPAPVEHALFRWVQEALTNTIKHAHARAVTLHIEWSTHETVFEYQDDGVGFGGPVPQSLAERAASVGAAVALTDSPGGGAALRLNLPRALS